MRPAHIFVAAIFAFTPFTASAQARLSLAERVANLPDREFMSWFMTMLSGGYHRMPGWERYFGDVGPTEGCEPLREIAATIARRDLALYRSAFLDMISKSFRPDALIDVPDNSLAANLGARSASFGEKLAPMVQPRVAEMAVRADGWIDAHGYRGRRLGYNSAGIAYWEGRYGVARLICAMPAGNAQGVLRGWKEGSPAK